MILKYEIFQVLIPRTALTRQTNNKKKPRYDNYSLWNRHDIQKGVPTLTLCGPRVEKNEILL